MSFRGDTAVLVLAAGPGTRMRSDTPKVLHGIGGRSMLAHSVHATSKVAPQHLVVVLGHAHEQITPVVAELADTLVRQEGLSFRQAHEIAAAVARTVVGMQGDVAMDGFGAFLTAFEAMAGRRPEIDAARFAEIVSPEYFVAVRDRLGGPAPAALERAIKGYRVALAELQGRSRRYAARDADALGELEGRFGEHLEGDPVQVRFPLPLQGEAGPHMLSAHHLLQHRIAVDNKAEYDERLPEDRVLRVEGKNLQGQIWPISLSRETPKLLIHHRIVPDPAFQN